MSGKGGASAALGRRLATVTLVVADYDEAIAWYRDRLGFAVAEDVDLGGGKRWVTLAPGRGRCETVAGPRRRRATDDSASATRPAGAWRCSWKRTILPATIRR